MKNLISIFLLILHKVSNSQSIQEFYDLFKYAQRKSAQNTSTNQVTIGEKDAFIKIQNPKIADDAISFKCFTKEDKTKIFGFQYSASQRALGLIMWRTEFYVYKNKKWQEITNQVRPALGFKDYWGTQTLPNSLLQEFNLDMALAQKTKKLC